MFFFFYCQMMNILGMMNSDANISFLISFPPPMFFSHVIFLLLHNTMQRKYFGIRSLHYRFDHLRVSSNQRHLMQINNCICLSSIRSVFFDSFFFFFFFLFFSKSLKRTVPFFTVNKCLNHARSQHANAYHEHYVMDVIKTFVVNIWLSMIHH
jgi:hypothetical protein